MFWACGDQAHSLGCLGYQAFPPLRGAWSRRQSGRLRAGSYVTPYAEHAGRPFSGRFRLAVRFEVSIAIGITVTLNKLEGFIVVLGYNVEAARVSHIPTACPCKPKFFEPVWLVHRSLQCGTPARIVPICYQLLWMTDLKAAREA